MSTEIGTSIVGNRESEGPSAEPLLNGHEGVAADTTAPVSGSPANAEEDTCPDSDGARQHPVSPSCQAALPPGYRLVRVEIEHQTGPPTCVVEDLPVEVLPGNTFADLCDVALARVPDVPQEYGMKAFLVEGPVQVPLADPFTTAVHTLRSFSPSASLLFLLDPEAAAVSGSGAARGLRVSPRLTSARRQRPWLRRLAGVAIGVAKFVLAVEMAALVQGGLRGALRRLTGRRGGAGGGGSGSGVGSDTEAVMDAVADYVSGRADLRTLERFDPRDVRAALEALDTEVLEQLDVPDPRAARAAVSNILRQVREQEQAVAKELASAAADANAAEAAATANAERDAAAPSASTTATTNPAVAGAGTETSGGSSKESPQGGGSSSSVGGSSRPSSGPGDQAAGAGDAVPEPMPGFGPPPPRGTAPGPSGRNPGGSSR